MTTFRDVLALGITGCLAAISACSPLKGAKGAESGRDSLIAVHYRTHVSGPERTKLDSLLMRIRNSDSGAKGSLDGELDRLPSRQDSSRFVLTMVRSGNGSDGQIVLYVLGSSVPGGVSAPYNTGIVDQPGRFRPLPIADFDGDGLADYAYCSWQSDSGIGELHVVGFGPPGWYSVVRFARAKPECGAGSAP